MVHTWTRFPLFPNEAMASALKSEMDLDFTKGFKIFAFGCSCFWPVCYAREHTGGFVGLGIFHPIHLSAFLSIEAMAWIIRLGIEGPSGFELGSEHWPSVKIFGRVMFWTQGRWDEHHILFNEATHVAVIAVMAAWSGSNNQILLFVSLY